MQPFVLEGGSIDTDGEGTLLTTAECLLSVNRNEYLQREELENYLKQMFGFRRILWLENGYLAGDDTDSHELKGFAKTNALKPGGSLLVQVSIPIKSLASFDEESSSWKIENGLYQFQIASSSRDIKFSLPVQLEGQTTETVVPVLLPENK